MSFFNCGLQVRVCGGPDKGRTFPLDSREVTIGRARNPGDRAPGWVLLNDPQISRIHADLVWSESDNAYKVVHRSETNPTEVNGVEIGEPTLIKIGDVVHLGASSLDIQQADFRFGGVEPERIGQIHQARKAGISQVNPALAFRDPKKEVEAHIDTKSGGRKIALSTRPKMVLQVLGGAQQGLELPLNGFQIQFGGHQVEELPDKEPWWDQDLVVEEATLPYRCMAFLWRELQNAFEVSFVRPVNLSITLERRVDGTEWIAEMPLSTPVMLRASDLLYIGGTAIQLVALES